MKPMMQMRAGGSASDRVRHYSGNLQSGRVDPSPALGGNEITKIFTEKRLSPARKSPRKRKKNGQAQTKMKRQKS